MRTIVFTSLLALAGLIAYAAPSVAPDDTKALTAASRLESLGWLEGHWKGKLGNGGYETVYSSPDAGMIVGASKQTSGGRAQSFDFERMYTKGDAVVMTPYPGGRESVTFELIDHDPAKKRAVFSNPKHDFPQSLTYEIVGSKGLHITLAGDMGGQSGEMTLELERVRKE